MQLAPHEATRSTVNFEWASLAKNVRLECPMSCVVSSLRSSAPHLLVVQLRQKSLDSGGASVDKGKGWNEMHRHDKKMTNDVKR